MGLVDLGAGPPGSKLHTKGWERTFRNVNCSKVRDEAKRGRGRRTKGEDKRRAQGREEGVSNKKAVWWWRREVVVREICRTAASGSSLALDFLAR